MSSMIQEPTCSDPVCVELSQHVIRLQNLLHHHNIDPNESTLYPTSPQITTPNPDFLYTIAQLRQQIHSQSSLIQDQALMIQRLEGCDTLSESSSTTDILQVVQEETKLLHNEVNLLRTTFEVELDSSRKLLSTYQEQLNSANKDIQSLETQLEESCAISDQMTKVAEQLQTNLDRMTEGNGVGGDWEERALEAERRLEEQNEEFSQRARELSEVYGDMKNELEKVKKERDDLKKISIDGQSELIAEFQSKIRELTVLNEDLTIRNSRTFSELKRAVYLLTREEEKTKKLSSLLSSSQSALSLTTRLLSLPPRDASLIIQAMVMIGLYQAGERLLEVRPELKDKEVGQRKEVCQVDRDSEKVEEDQNTKSLSSSFDQGRLERLKKQRKRKDK
ncbi:hypothetical protein P9112_008149 [Eukaryota sp. TZLM1-RC]